jgi:hypothetical protein
MGVGQFNLRRDPQYPLYSIYKELSYTIDRAMVWMAKKSSGVLIPCISKGFPFSSMQSGSETRLSYYLTGSNGQFVGPLSWPLTATFRMVDVRRASTSTTPILVYLHGVLFIERRDNCTFIFTCCCVCSETSQRELSCALLPLLETLSALENPTTEMAVGCNRRQIWLWNTEDVFEWITEGWCRHRETSNRWNCELEVTG